MAKKFKFLTDIATAELAFEAYGKDLSQLFENAGLALEQASVEADSVEPKEERKLSLEESSVENLLFAFLEELVFLKDSEQIVFNRIKCKVKEVKKGLWRLESALWGEKIDRGRHKFGIDVKAVTKHIFEVKKLEDGTWLCRVVLDV